MRVVEVTAFGGPDVLHLRDQPDPVGGPGEVVVRIRAATVNPTDLTARSGEIRARLPDLRPPFVPGWDLSGDVIAVGPGVGDHDTGDRVVGMIPWRHIGGRRGAYAEAVALDSRWVVPMPAGVDLAAAATLPLGALTAVQGLDMLAAPPGSRLLVTGASGAVGGFATQLAVQAGHDVLAVAGRDDEEWVAALGPSEVLPRSVDFRTLDPVAAVFDAVPIGQRVTAALSDRGSVVLTRPRPIRPERGIRFATVWIDPDQAALQRLATDLGTGRLCTRVAEVLPLEAAAQAHARTEAGGLHGKIVLVP